MVKSIGNQAKFDHYRPNDWFKLKDLLGSKDFNKNSKGTLKGQPFVDYREVAVVQRTFNSVTMWEKSTYSHIS